ncbi:MAG: hypothetical protein EB120_10530, partial [Proteobacteria bacterium]|nr:hypothetical protein [Pseudomonadota bacterium]
MFSRIDNEKHKVGKCIYLIGSENNKRVKIGKTNNLNNRLGDLSTGIGKVIIHHIRYIDYFDLKFVESTIHNVLHKFRV